MKYEIFESEGRQGSTYRICDVGNNIGVRISVATCDSLADAEFLRHALEHLTDEQRIAACQAATDACERRREND